MGKGRHIEYIRHDLTFGIPDLSPFWSVAVLTIPPIKAIHQTVVFSHPVWARPKQL